MPCHTLEFEARAFISPSATSTCTPRTGSSHGKTIQIRVLMDWDSSIENLPATHAPPKQNVPLAHVDQQVLEEKISVNPPMRSGPDSIASHFASSAASFTRGRQQGGCLILRQTPKHYKISENQGSSGSFGVQARLLILTETMLAQLTCQIKRKRPNKYNALG
jgi:hypothetical protein